MNNFLMLILVVTLVSSGVTASWWRRLKDSWRRTNNCRMSACHITGRDVEGQQITQLAKSLGFESDSEEFLDLFKIADKDGNGKLDAMEAKHLKQLAQGMLQEKEMSLKVARSIEMLSCSGALIQIPLMYMSMR